MKFDRLRSIGHNIADSLADGNGFLIGVYYMNVFEEAAKIQGRSVEVDFLTGRSSMEAISADAARVFQLYGEAVDAFCKKHRGSRSDFRKLSARFFAEYPRRFMVTVEDQHGRRATDEYVGLPGKRIRVVDRLGRVRRQPGRVVRIKDDAAP